MTASPYGSLGEYETNIEINDIRTKATLLKTWLIRQKKT